MNSNKDLPKLQNVELSKNSYRRYVVAKLSGIVSPLTFANFF